MVNFTFSIASEIAVVDYNPEYADLDHPNGEIEGLVFFVVATDRDGNRLRSDILPEDVATRRAAALNELAGRPMQLLWEEWYPVYGSAAYVPADELAWEKSLEDERTIRDAEYRSLLRCA